MVNNRDAAPLRDVMVLTSRGSFPMGSVASKTVRAVRVEVPGKSGLELKYKDKAGEEKALTIDCYLDLDSRGTVEAEVKAGKIVRVTNNLNTSHR